MKRFLLFGLMGLLLTACSKDEVDDINNNITNHSDIRYQGIWSIDDKPIEQYYTVAYGQTKSGTIMIVAFINFPYQALADHILTNINVAEIANQTRPFQIRVSMVGNSVTQNYYNASDEKSYYNASDDKMYECYGTYLTFDVITKDEGKVTIKLGLQADESIFSFSDNAASCVLVIERAELTYENGEQKTLMLNPARKMTFVSTKRIQ